MRARIPRRPTTRSRRSRSCTKSSSSASSARRAGTSGASVRRDQAEELQRQTGQERLLRVIGETARLEERSVLEVVPGSDPRPDHLRRPRRSGPARCSFDALANRRWSTRARSGTAGGEVRARPGRDRRRGLRERGGGRCRVRGSSAASRSGPSTSSSTATAPIAFADATTAAVGAPPPTEPDRHRRRPRRDLLSDGPVRDHGRHRRDHRRLLRSARRRISRPS